jgi:hypothetical protein
MKIIANISEVIYHLSRMSAKCEVSTAPQSNLENQIPESLVGHDFGYTRDD